MVSTPDDGAFDSLESGRLAADELEVQSMRSTGYDERILLNNVSFSVRLSTRFYKIASR